MHLVYPPTILQNYCFLFLLGITVPREIENNNNAKFVGLNKVHYGLFENGESQKKVSAVPSPHSQFDQL